MATDVTVVVPFRTKGDSWRDAVNDWVLERWQMLLPEAEVISCDSGLDPFCHASSINQGARSGTGNLLVIADADIAVNTDVLDAALQVANDDGWALAERYCALTEPQSRALLDTSPLTIIEPAEPDWVSVNVNWAGFLTVNRQTFVEHGGHDERLSGWAPDDIALAAKLDTLIAPVTRVSGPLFHLWHHANLDDTFGVEGYHAKRDLAHTYVDARGNPDRMRQVMA